MIESLRIKSGLCVLAAGAAMGLLGVSSAAVAGVPEEPSMHTLTPAEIQSGALTIERGHDGVRYVAGGIGIEERAWLAAHATKFNTRLTFAVVPGGAFIADVQVRIRNAQGRDMVDTTAQGPQLMAELPPGTYQLTATHDGQSVHRAFTLASHGHVALNLGFKS